MSSTKNALGFEIQTKNEGVQAVIRHVFIHQHFLFSLNVTTKKLNKVPMLKLGNEAYFIFEFIQSLSRTFRKPLDSNFLSIY